MIAKAMFNRFVIAVCVVSAAISPLAGQTRFPGALPRPTPVRSDTPAAPAGELLSSRFEALLAEVSKIIRGQREKSVAAPIPDSSEELENLLALKQQLAAEHEKHRQYFSRVEEVIRLKGLSPEIRQRHSEFLREYQSRYELLMTHLADIELARQSAKGLLSKLTRHGPNEELEQALSETAGFLGAQTALPRPPLRLDPHNLPLRSLQATNATPPRLTREEWLRAFPGEGAHRKFENSLSSLATSPPTPADLAETIEVKFTPEIRQLAESLGRNPVRIFNWVRNNIEFAPTWGSIQGAQLCLEARACNAFDTSSLLIALFRASNISARYQLGTIEVPIAKFENWAGGFTNAEAAASLFASGGIPSVVRRIDQTGGVFSVKLEHVWVKAFVDYAPSGGAVHSQGDAWVDLDPAFKQYRVNSPAEDLTVAVPFDRDRYLQSDTANSPVDFYRRNLTTYIQQNHPGQTLEDFLVRRSIIPQSPGLLGVALPYRVVIKGVEFSGVPNTLRQKVTLVVGQSSSAGLSYTAFLPEILDKRITLSFVPASAADTQVAAGFDGLYLTPAYLLSVNPILRLNGAETARGPVTRMGQPLSLSVTIGLADGSERHVQHSLTAGQYGAILLAPHVVSDQTLVRPGKEFVAGDQRFGSLNIDNSDRDSWVGSGLRIIGSSYANRLDAATASLTELFPIGQVKTVAEALVSSDVEVTSLFGAPGRVRPTGMTIDAQLLEEIVIPKNGQGDTATRYEKLRGLESSYWEHAIFEAGGAIPDRASISTVRVLQRAAAAGLQIIKVNQSNVDTVVPQLQLSNEVKQRIQDGVNAGLEVTTPTSNIQLGGWNGVGYVIEDPQTGAGAYEISGGFAGGILKFEPFGLVGGRLTPRPFNRSAVIAVGGAVNYSIGSLITHLVCNKFTVSESLGSVLFGTGYNVYIAEPYADEFVSFVNGTGTRNEDKDIFFYIGHGGDGDLCLPDRNESVQWFSPSTLSSRHFKASLLAACATGGICPANFLTVVTVGCDEHVELERAWQTALIGPIACSPGTPDCYAAGKVVVGSYSVTRMVPQLFEANLFWEGLLDGVRADDMTAVIQFSYLRGDPNTTLP